jgi:uncharacterized protein (DUF934 family)
MSNLIKLENGIASVVENEWQCVELPASDVAERVQAGKVVLFKLTGENTVTEAQIANTVIPATGKVIVPLSVYAANKNALADRMHSGAVGIWLATHETLESLMAQVDDINNLPIIAIHVARFADGRIFSLGTLLRTRYGYKNELRAFGDVLRDQLFFLKRSGFTSFLIRADRSATDALASLKDFTVPYQGAVDEPKPVFQRYNRTA